MVRITTGSLKGFVVTVPRHIRATEGKVRQALFNILGSRVVGAQVIDGFAGSGALGLEALSRGAGFVAFLERHPLCARTIQGNLDRITPGAVSGRWLIVRGDALQSMRSLASQSGPFDVVLLDPPYAGGMGKKALQSVAECAILARTGIVCLEHAHRRQAQPAVGSLTLTTQHRYGETVLSFYYHRSSVKTRLHTTE